MGETLLALALRITGSAATQRERARRLHDFVRDSIAYGFTPVPATPEHTLATARGHAVAKAELFVALLRAAGIAARLRFFLIDRALLRGVLAPGDEALLPWEMLHACTEMSLAGRWLRCDSYALDRPLWCAAVLRLKAEGLLLGYAAHRQGTAVWDGHGHAYAQFVSADMLLEDHGSFASLAEYRSGRASRTGRQILWPDEIAGVIGTGGSAPHAAESLNLRLDRLRRYCAAGSVRVSPSPATTG